MASNELTLGDAVTALLAYIRDQGPIGAVGSLIGAVTLLLAVFFLVMKIVTRLPGNHGFDVGKTFDHYYKPILPAVTASALWLIYAAYAGLLLSLFPVRHDFRWLHLPFYSLFVGVVATLIVVGVAAKGFAELGKAMWFALHWISLEARGITWHLADASGEPYRVLWRRPNGESLYDLTTRDERLRQEIAAIRTRRHKLLKETALAALSILTWLYAPELFKSFYPLLPSGVVAFFEKANEEAVIAFLTLLFAVIPNTVACVAAILDVLFYRMGAQYVTGARVNDPRPTPPGRGDVEKQKAHGDADFVSADEAVRRMAGKRRR